jgi:Mg-chelatase subunit ChlD
VVALLILSGGCASHPTQLEVDNSAPPPPLKLWESPAPPQASAARSSYEELSVAVYDSTGTTIRDLKQSDVIVGVNGQQTAVASFAEVSNAPTSLVVVIDSSGSMKPKLEAVQKSLGTLFQNLNACDEIGIVSFGGESDTKIKVVHR